MKSNSEAGRKRAKALLTAALAGLFLWGAPEPVRAVPGTAHRFVCNLAAVEAAGGKMSFWDRVTVSLVLAGGNPRRQSS
ncbi:MAG: hypothetical protein HY821_13780 [Acidobacteria bacterium]|nr:hypothetical protein [Acidobacteriota bacterium]